MKSRKVNFLGFHSELLDEIESLENVILRDYKGQDRYVINRDNEELFIAIIGEREDNLLTIYTTDKQHIRILGFFSADSLFKGRKF